MEGKFKIETNEKSRIRLPEGYSTNVEFEKKVIDLFNENDPKWVEKINKKNIVVKGKTVEDSLCVMLRAEAVLDYPEDLVFKAMTDFEVAKKCNTQFYGMEAIDFKEFPDHSECIFHMMMKCPFPLSDRDFVERRYEYKTYGGEKTGLILWHSVVDERFPEKKKPVRAEMMINAQYIKAINDKQTQLYVLNFADPKITSAVQGLVNRLSPGAQETYVTDLIKSCEMLLKSK